MTSDSSVLVIGGSGGTGHVALQITRCLGASRISTICSGKNADFCSSCGATDIIDYTKPADSMMEDIINSPNKPFHVVLDCVSSEDPRDQATDYPKLIQGTNVEPRILTEDYVYRRLVSCWFGTNLGSSFVAKSTRKTLLDTHASKCR